MTKHLVFLLLVSCSAAAQATTVQQHVETLSADDMAGRLTGEKGAKKAVDYIERQLKEMDVQPLPGHKSLRHEFEFTAGAEDDEYFPFSHLETDIIEDKVFAILRNQILYLNDFITTHLLKPKLSQLVSLRTKRPQRNVLFQY